MVTGFDVNFSTLSPSPSLDLESLDPVVSKVDTPDYAIGEEDFQGGEPESTFTISGDGLISVEIEDNAIIEDTASIETRGSQGKESEMQ